MTTSLALASVGAAAFYGPHVGFGFPWLFFLIPLFWILVFVVIFAIFGRRWRRARANGYGWGPGYPGHGGPWAGMQAARSAEATLAERFAKGDIDETEYRARLEVIRANSPQPPTR